jgi:hypothetical protein
MPGLEGYVLCGHNHESFPSGHGLKKFWVKTLQGEVRPKIAPNPEKALEHSRKTLCFALAKEQNLKKF